jgi:UDP-glucose:(heptosyl)LPS alpha-1,3-glucosyltransferase
VKLALIRRHFAEAGGAELYLQRLLGALVRAGHEPHLFAEHWQPLPEGVRLHRMVVSGSRGRLPQRFAEAVERELATEDFDCVFSLERTLRQDVYRAGDGVHRLWLRRRRQYAPWWKRPFVGAGPFHRTMLALERQAFDANHTRHLIVNSDMVRREITEEFHFPAERIHLVRNGVEVARFRRGRRAETRAQFGVSEQDFLLLFVGSGWERKGLKFLLRFMAQVAAGTGAAGQLKLLVLGRGRWPGHVPPSVIFAGANQRVEDAYAAADLFTFLPIYEPSANVVAEALAAGLPVVTSRFNGAAEMLREGINGTVLADPADLPALALAVEYWRTRGPARPVPCELPLELDANVAATLRVLELAAQERAAGRRSGGRAPATAPTRMKLSFCLITLNEEANLRRCLQSCAGLADEFVIVDSGSTDGTEAIAREFGARWQTQDWLGYVGQKNLALSLAQHEWVFSLDADEELSPALRAEIQQLRESGPADGVSGYRLPRCVFYEGRWIRHGDWYPDRLVRLFRRSQAQFAGGKVHERLEVRGPVASLDGELFHYSFRDRADHEARGQKYARLWAEMRAEAGRRAGPLDAWLHAATRWLRGYVLRRGFLDGRQGWQIAALSAREVALKYRLLRELSQRPLTSAVPGSATGAFARLPGPPPLTVAICTHNRATLTAEAVRSVLPQLRAGDELIVVDNGSTDDTPAVVRQAAAGHAAVRVVPEPELGLSVARNRALHEARNEFVIFLDDDATARPGWLEAYRKCFAAPPSLRLAAVGGPVRPRYELPPPAWVSPRDNRLDLGTVPREFPPRGGPWGCNFALHRARALECGAFDPRFGPTGTSRIVADETELFGRLRAVGWEIWWLPGPMIDHTVVRARICVNYFLRNSFGLGRSAARQRLKEKPDAATRFGFRVARLAFMPVHLAVCALAGALGCVRGNRSAAAHQLFRAARDCGFARELLSWSK